MRERVTLGGRVAIALAALASLGLAGCATEVVEAGPEVPDPSGVQVVVVSTSVPPDSVADGPTTTFAIGDCITWDQGATTAVFEQVDCGDPHLAEVAGLLDLSEVYPPDADLPTTEDLVAEGADACPGVVEAYLGRPPATDEEGGVLVPSAADWDAGGRTWLCTIGFAREDGFRPAYTGRLAQDDAELS